MKYPLDDVISVEFEECTRLGTNDPAVKKFDHLPPLLYKRCVRHDETRSSLTRFVTAGISDGSNLRKWRLLAV